MDKKLIVGIGADTSDLEAKAKKAGTVIAEFADTSIMNIGEMRRELKTLGKMSLEGLSPEQIAQVTARMAELTDATGDAAATIKQMSLDPFQKMASSIQSVSTLAQGVTGTMQMFGAESETVNKLMAQTVGLMGIANAAQEASVLFKERALGLTIKQIALDIQRNGLMATFNALTAANPMGAILVAVLALGAGLYAVTAAMQKAYDITDKIKAKITEINDAIADTKGWNEFKNKVQEVWGTGSTGKAIADLEEYRYQLERLRDEQAALSRSSSNKDEIAKAEAEYKRLGDELIKVGDEIILTKAKQRKKEIDDEKAKNEKLAADRKKAYEESDQGRLDALQKQYDEESRLLKNQLNNEAITREEYAKKANEMTGRYAEEAGKYKGKSGLRVAFDAPTIESEPITVEPASIDFKIDEEKAKKALEDAVGDLPEKVEKIKFPEDTIDLSGAIGSGVENLAAILGEAIGSGDWSNFGANILAAIAGFMQQVGAMFIAFGVAKVAFTKPSGPALIAAGAAMVAIGAAIKSATSKSSTSKVLAGGSSSGGSGGSGTGWDVSRAQASWSEQNVQFRISGTDLVGVLGNESSRRNSY